MNAKRVKRICGVRGCRNTEAFSISRTRETGNTVIICKECLEKALKALENVEDTPKVVHKAEAEPLFFHPELTEAPEEPEKNYMPDDAVDVATTEGDDAEEPEGKTPEGEEPDEETNPENTAYICMHCRKGFKSERGLNMHMKTCKAKTE